VKLCSLIPLVVLVSCGGSQPEPTQSDTTPWVRLKTGKHCAHAKVACAPGNCAANVDNTCKTPVTCKLHMESICRSFTGEEGPATATSSKYTILSGDKQGLGAKVICDAGDVFATIARTVHCF
jgi:hypothetical protein